MQFAGAALLIFPTPERNGDGDGAVMAVPVDMPENGGVENEAIGAGVPMDGGGVAEIDGLGAEMMP